jgi:hypothetical protein
MFAFILLNVFILLSTPPLSKGGPADLAVKASLGVGAPAAFLHISPKNEKNLIGMRFVTIFIFQR